MKKKFKFRFFSLVMAMILALGGMGGAIPAMAAEVDDTTGNVVESMDRVEEAELLRERIDEIISEQDKTRDTYKTDYWGHVEVTGKHTGGWHTIYGNYARVAIAFKPTDGNAALVASLSTSFWGWSIYYNPDNTDENGYYMYVSDWYQITYQGAYRMEYILSTAGSSGYDPNDERSGDFHIWIDYK